MQMRRRPRERRASARKPVTWAGRCGTNSRPEWEWRPCTVEDVSHGGARLTTDNAVDVRVGNLIGISVERLGDTTVGIKLRGQVRHVVAQGTGFSVGVKLDFASPQERRIAEMLFAG